MLPDPTVTAGVLAILTPVAPQLAADAKEFLITVFGDATNELRLFVGDKVREYRLSNLIRIAARARQRCIDAGISPKAVRLHELFPALENASLIDDTESEIEAKWVGLLASAAAAGGVHPSYPVILAELESVEARIVDALYEHHLQLPADERFGWGNPFWCKKLVADVDLDRARADISFNNLERVRLMRTTSSGFDKSTVGGRAAVGLTTLGFDFVRVCRGPTG